MQSEFINSASMFARRPIKVSNDFSKSSQTTLTARAQAWFKSFSETRKHERGFADHTEQKKFEDGLNQKRMSARIHP